VHGELVQEPETDGHVEERVSTSGKGNACLWNLVLHLNCGQQNVVCKEGVKGGVCNHKSVVRLCMRGCHLELFHGSLISIDLSPVSQNVVELSASEFWVSGR
jgi:hypothetical protein